MGEAVLLRGAAVDVAARRVARDDGAVTLTPTEARLFAYLVAHPGEVLSPERLLVEVWGYREGVRSRTVYATIDRLRRKVELNPTAPQHIVTADGGYRFEPLAEEDAPVDLIGRDALFRALLAQLAQASGAVSLVGPSGVGKSTLARAVARRLTERAARAVVWVDAAGVADADALDLALRDAMGLPPEGAVRPALAGRAPLLLVLDDADAAPEAAIRELASLPAVFCVCTAKRRPAEGAWLDVPLLEVAAARALLARRVGERGGAIDGVATAELDAICEAVDRLPLSVELMAERLCWLPVHELQARIEGLRRADAAQGHTPLRASLEAAVGALEPADREALARLAAMPGAVPLSLAEALLADLGAPLARVERLVRSSLVMAERAPVARLRLLHAVRDHMVPAEVAPEVAVAIRGWLDAVAADVEAATDGPDEAAVVARVAPHRALWLALLGRAEAGDRARWLVAIAPLLRRIGAVGPLEGWLAEAHAAAEGATRAKLAVRLGVERQYRAGDALGPLREAVSLQGALEAEWRGRAGIECAIVERALGDVEGAARRLAEVVALGASAPVSVARAIGEEANLLRAAGRWEEAERRYADALARARRLGLRRVENAVQSGLGSVYRSLGRPLDAELAYAAAVRGAEEAGDEVNAMVARGNLANLFVVEGRDREAGALLADCSAYYRSHGMEASLGFVAYAAAVMHGRAQAWRRAAQHAREAAMAFHASGRQREGAFAEAMLGRVALCLGDAASARAHFDRAVAEAPPSPEAVAGRWIGLRALAEGDDGAASIAEARRRLVDDPLVERLAAVIGDPEGRSALIAQLASGELDALLP